MNILEHYNPDKLKINDPVNLDDDTYFCKLKLNNIEWMDICGNDVDNKCSF